jgi:hypothetical protein
MIGDVNDDRASEATGDSSDGDVSGMRDAVTVRLQQSV